ncbi:MAG: hypothetical protein WC916_02070 [Candidatus Woesearchaeota archaeon]
MKRGQITIFVILGLLLVIIAGVTYYFIYKAKTTEPVTRTEVSLQLKPLQAYVENCMNQVGREGIILLGQHGGYIDPQDEYLSGRSFIQNPQKQYESDLTYTDPDDLDTGIPYWYYTYTEGSCDHCTLMSQTPYLDEMERQLSIYISENIADCFNDFAQFKAQGFIMNYSKDFLVRTTIREQDVVFEAVYPINVTTPTEISSIEKYYTTVDVPLQKYYLMALNITATEFETGYLENLNTFLIYSYSGLDSNMLPPLYARSDNYNVYFWTQTSVKEKYHTLLQSYVPLFQVPGTKGYQVIPTTNLKPYEKSFYNALTLDFFEKENLETTTIDFSLPQTDIYLKIRPSDGELIGPSKTINTPGIALLPPEQSTIYQYFYDISYPIIVTIRDEYKPNQYYTFMFSLESTTKQNQNIRSWLNESNRPYEWAKGTLQYQLGHTTVGQTVQYRNQNYTIKDRPKETLFCATEQQLSGLITLKVLDAYNQKSLNTVAISYGCGGYAECPLGQIKYNATTKMSEFKGKLPLCVNGFIQLEKFGYLTKKIPLTTQTGKSQNLGIIYLEPVVELNVSVDKYFIERKYTQNTYLGKLLNPTPLQINENDTVMITFERITRELLEESWTQTIVVGRNATDKPLPIRLVAGNYEVKAQYIDYEGFSIPKECKEICVDGPYPVVGCLKHDYIPKQSINITPAMWGGISYNSSNSIGITADDLQNSHTLHVSVLRIPNPRCIDDLKEIGEIPALSETYRQTLKPHLE